MPDNTRAKYSCMPYDDPTTVVSFALKFDISIYPIIIVDNGTTGTNRKRHFFLNTPKE